VTNHALSQPVNHLSPRSGKILPLSVAEAGTGTENLLIQVRSEAGSESVADANGPADEECAIIYSIKREANRQEE
jgi:hypothetical protein